MILQHKFKILSLVFLVLSLTGGVFLVKQPQNTQKSAQEECWKLPDGTPALCTCDCGKTFCANPQGRGCFYDCLAECGSGSHYGELPGGDCSNVRLTSTCIESRSGTLDVVNHYSCPGLNSIPAAGCQDNIETNRNVTKECVDEDFCGVQQIDYNRCFVTYLKQCNQTPTTPPQATNTPTSTPTPTSTIKPTSTPTPTPIPTNTPTPTLTPTGTPQPTSTPTNTPTPTLTPTGTPQPTSTPTNTPTPTPTSISTTNTPTPTRIILPQAGVDFPIKMLSILGGILTITGILLVL